MRYRFNQGICTGNGSDVVNLLPWLSTKEGQIQRWANRWGRCVKWSLIVTRITTRSRASINTAGPMAA